MSKPWDHLKWTESEHHYPKIGVGEWKTTNCMPVEVQHVGTTLVDITFETGLRPPWSASAVDLRELAEFCTELAAQLESK